MLLESFPPCYSRNAKVLILGSMPGQASLSASQYYAHPRNQFWVVIADLIGSERPSAYSERLNWLKKHNIALWDVLKNCEREGSLDSNIKNQSQVVNPLLELISLLPDLRAIAFNGKKAEQVFKRQYLGASEISDIALIPLPSTSPAHAAVSTLEKTTKWKSLLKPYLV